MDISEKSATTAEQLHARYHSPAAISHKLQSTVAFKFEYFINPACWLCTGRRKASAHSYFCDYCHAKLPWIEHSCICCGIQLESSLALSCARCQEHSPDFARCICAWQFKGNMIDMLHAFKYNERLDFGKALSLELCKIIQRKYRQLSYPDMLIAVPLHPQRLHMRGYNQAHEIATHLSRLLALRYYPHILTRTHATTSQQQLNAQQRKKNMRKAFRIAGKNQRFKHNINRIAGQHIALIDDVVTTGSTANAVSKVLMSHGAKQVDVWALARVNTL